jgi:colanic acid biosynthesis glycosyl transferase WcaI
VTRIVFLNRFFFPDHSATGQILSDLAFDLAASGRDVSVIACRQRYDDPIACLPAQENVRGVEVHRVAATQFGRSALFGRAIDYLSFCASVWRTALTQLRPGDILIAKTDPPLMSIVAMYVAKRRGARLVNWLQDIYPEVAIELGVPLIRGGLVSSSLIHMRDKSLNAAVANVVVGHRMAERLATRVPRDLIQVIPNWCDTDIVPISPVDNPLRQQWGLQNKFVVGYSGNLGRAHEFETVLRAAERLRDDRIVFLFIGGGYRFDELAKSVDNLGLGGFFQFRPYQDSAMLKYSLSVADVHWISLRPELEGLVVPSKVYGILAAGRPLIAITAEDGEIARLIYQHGCGVVVAPGDSDAFIGTLLSLEHNSQRRALLGSRARHALEGHFTRQHAFMSWSKLLDTLV